MQFCLDGLRRLKRLALLTYATFLMHRQPISSYRAIAERCCDSWLRSEFKNYKLWITGKVVKNEIKETNYWTSDNVMTEQQFWATVRDLARHWPFGGGLELLFCSRNRVVVLVLLFNCGNCLWSEPVAAVCPEDALRRASPAQVGRTESSFSDIQRFFKKPSCDQADCHALRTMLSWLRLI